MVSSLDSGDWFTPGIYDVSPSTEEEGEEAEEAKEADVCNESENKMNSWKTNLLNLFEIILGLLTLTLMSHYIATNCIVYK